MRGTGYVITEISLWLMVAALVGVAFGWLVRGWRSEKKIRKGVESSVEEARSKAADLAKRLAEAEARIELLSGGPDDGAGVSAESSEDESSPDGEHAEDTVAGDGEAESPVDVDDEESPPAVAG